MGKEENACEQAAIHQLACEWYTHFQGTIRSALAGRVKRSADVDDLSHEVYLRLLKVPEPESVQNPQAYVYRVAINVAEEWKQRAVQRFNHSSDSLPTLVSDYGPEEWFRQHEQHTLVKKKLAGIPVSSRTAMMLHVRDGKVLRRNRCPHERDKKGGKKIHVEGIRSAPGRAAQVLALGIA